MRKVLTNSRGINGFILILVGLALLAAFVVIINALFISRDSQTASQPQQPVLQSFSPTPPIVPSQTGWETYTSTEGRYALRYPQGYEIIENKVVSVDGVEAPAGNTLTLVSNVLPGVNTNFVLTIHHRGVEDSTLLEWLVDTNDWCSYISSNKAKIFMLAGRKALIFEDTPCGPYGSTVIYSINDGNAYLIKVESGTSYENIKDVVDTILSTVVFSQNTSN